MKRVAQQCLFIMLLVGGVCYGQSVADLARETRKQQANKGAPGQVISTDDVSLVTPTMIPSIAALCAHEHQTCKFSGTQTIAYGANGHYNFKSGVTGSVECSNESFGDPIYGAFKDCYVVPASAMAALERSGNFADGAVQRENRKHQANNGAPSKVISNDDVDPFTTGAQLLPGSSFAGKGTLVAPGRGNHSYRCVILDATRFANGGTLHITATLGNGESDASFDLYPEGVQPPTQGLPNSLAHAWDVARNSTVRISYHFDQGKVFQFCAEGNSWAKFGTTNTYSFSVDVQTP